MRATHVREIRGKVTKDKRAEALRITDEEIFPELAKIPGFVRAESLVSGEDFQFIMYFDDRLFPPQEHLPEADRKPVSPPRPRAGAGGSASHGGQEFLREPHDLLDDDDRGVQCPLRAEAIDQLLGEMAFKTKSCIEIAGMTVARVLYQRDYPAPP